MYFPQLQELSDTSSIYCHAMQLAFARRLEALGEHRYDVDLQEGLLAFTGEGGRSWHVRTDMVASLAPGPRSLVWGWTVARPGWVEPRGALALREYGRSHGVPMLTEAEVPFDVPATDGPSDWCRRAVHDIGRALVAVTGDAPYLAVDPGNGSQQLLAVLGHDLPTPRLDETLPPLALHGRQGADVRDHRRAIHCFATKSGWQLQWAPDLTSLVVIDPVNGNSASLSFDALGRNDRMNLTLGGGRG